MPLPPPIPITFLMAKESLLVDESNALWASNEEDEEEDEEDGEGESLLTQPRAVFRGKSGSGRPGIVMVLLKEDDDD